MKTAMKGFVVLAFLSIGIPSSNAGILDLRLGAGLSAANPSSFEKRVNNLSGTQLKADNFETYNADAVFHLPLIPVTLGVRYERANQNKSASASEWKLNVSNLALLADWRIVNTVVYVGPLVSIGYPWADLKFVNGGSGSSNHLNSQQLSYSGGLEAGVYLGPFLVGAEAGYKSIRLKGSSAVNTNVNLEGFYGKALVGMTFL